jgi:ABC-2 type transport system permease protein
LSLGRLLIVTRREYLERVRSKAFMVSTVLGPLIMGALVVLPGLLMSRQRREPLRIAVLDEAGALGPKVEAALGERRRDGAPRFAVRPAGEGPVAGRRDALREQVMKGELDGYLVLPVETLESSVAEYHGRNVSNFEELRHIDDAVEDAVVGTRLTGAGLAPDRVRALTRKPDLKTIRVTAQGLREDRRGMAFVLAFMLVSLLYTSLAIWGAAIMNGVLEEKTNRVVEVMVSSVSPDTLLSGKLLGVGAAGLTQLMAWALTMGLIGIYVGSGAVAGGASVPEVGVGVLVAFVLFFLLGFFLYGSLYAAVGAAVNSMQEAQNLILPLMMPVILAMMFFPMVLRSPDSTLAVALSLVPLLAPLLMFLRISVLMPPMWQVALSIGLTVLTIWGVVWMASRIYRVGILMYGKRPTFPEILRWVRAS